MWPSRSACTVQVRQVHVILPAPHPNAFGSRPFCRLPMQIVLARMGFFGAVAALGAGAVLGAVGVLAVLDVGGARAGQLAMGHVKRAVRLARTHVKRAVRLARTHVKRAVRLARTHVKRAVRALRARVSSMPDEAFNQMVSRQTHM